jgi:hypothetical protein
LLIGFYAIGEIWELLVVLSENLKVFGTFKWKFGEFLVVLNENRGFDSF